MTQSAQAKEQYRVEGFGDLEIRKGGDRSKARPAMTFQVQARLVIRLAYDLIGYRSPAAAGRLYRFEDAWYRWRADGGPLPQSRHFVTLLEHLHWARFHDFPFWVVQALEPGGEFEPLPRRSLPPIPDCKDNFGDDPDRRPIPKIWEWLSDVGTARNVLPFQISSIEGRPALEDHLTRKEWIRTVELAIWHVFGYRVADIFAMDWLLRTVTWRRGRRPKPRQDFTENPMDILARADRIQF